MKGNTKSVHVVEYCLHKCIVLFLAILGVMLFLTVALDRSMFPRIPSIAKKSASVKYRNEMMANHRIQHQVTDDHQQDKHQHTIPDTGHKPHTVQVDSPPGLYVRSTAKVIYGREKLRKKETSDLNTNGHSETESKLNRGPVNVESIYKKRLETLQKGCSSNPDDKMHARDPIFLYSNKTKAVACKGSKTGSSFLGAVFISLEVARGADEVFRINRNGVHARVKTLKHVLDDEAQNKNMESALKIVVARDPYQRLFSVYVDKIYLLGSIGRGVDKNYGRKTRENMKDYCGYNVTFQNYLSVVLPRALEGHSINPHWAPVSTLCAACDIDYNLICKTETLTRDTEYVLDKLNMSESRRDSIKSMFHDKGLSNTIYSLTAAYLADYKTYKEDCPNYMLLMEKIWNVFKIQGYLHDSIPFPKEDFEQLVSLDTQKITDIIVKGINTRPMAKGDKVLQRRKALVSGYADVKDETIKLIQQVYSLDFSLFGYSTSPPK